MSYPLYNPQQLILKNALDLFQQGLTLNGTRPSPSVGPIDMHPLQRRLLLRLLKTALAARTIRTNIPLCREIRFYLSLLEKSPGQPDGKYRGQIIPFKPQGYKKASLN